MSGPCKLGTFNDSWVHGGGTFGYTTPCACANCTEREAKVMAEANAKRKALLALDQAMTDLASADFSCWNHSKADGEYIIGLASNCNDAWRAARRFILPEERPE